MNSLRLKAHIFKEDIIKGPLRDRKQWKEWLFLKYLFANHWLALRHALSHLYEEATKSWGGRQKSEKRKKVKGFDTEFWNVLFINARVSLQENRRFHWGSKISKAGKQQSSHENLAILLIYFLHMFTFIFRITDILGILIYHPLGNESLQLPVFNSLIKFKKSWLSCLVCMYVTWSSRSLASLPSLLPCGLLQHAGRSGCLEKKQSGAVGGSCPWRVGHVPASQTSLSQPHCWTPLPRSAPLPRQPTLSTAFPMSDFMLNDGVCIGILSCCNKAPQTVWLKQESDRLTVLEARSPKSRYQLDFWV